MSNKVNSIAKNSFFLYIRMIILMGIGLYTSRVLLELLGVEDLGIYNVVGSVIMILDFVSSSLTNSSQRYLNIGLGKNDLELTNKYFSQSVGLHFILSIVIVILLETVGLWLLKTKLVIPESRIFAATWVYQLSVITAFFKINQICFQSAILARENMSMYAYLSIFEGVAKLLIVYLLAIDFSLDKLIFYTLLLLIVQIVIFLIHGIYCYVKYPESRYKYYWEKELSKEMLSFVGVNTFGYISWALGMQGINLVLNMFFGPVVNAARGLASTIERIVSQFVNNVYMAVKPQLIKSYAMGKIEEMLVLAEKSTIYIFFLVLMISLPILFETKFILQVWLKQVPQHTEMYVKLMIVQSFFWMLPIPYGQIATATGEIKNIQLYGRLFTLLSLPLSYLLLKMVQNPYYPIGILIAMDCFFWLYTIYDVNRQLKVKLSRYLINVIRPISIVSVCLVAAIGVLSYLLRNFSMHFVRFGIEVVASLIFGCLFVVLFGMPKADLGYARVYLDKKFKK